MHTAVNTVPARIQETKLGFVFVFDKDARPCGSNGSAVEKALRNQVPEATRAQVNGHRLKVRVRRGTSLDEVVTKAAQVVSGMIGAQVLVPQRTR